MAGNIGVSVTKLLSTADSVRGTNKQMGATLNTISTSISGLKGSWKGDAADQLTKIANNMQSVFTEFSKAVEDFARFLDNAAANYDKAETANVSNQSSNASMFR